jgi:diguanylate cyclase (GGDEF)-like protein
MKKYLDYLTEQKKIRIKRLDEKYQMNKKHKENELLEQKNQLRDLALQKTQQKKRSQYRNIIIVICTGLIFLLLLLRQFKIRKMLKYLAKTDSLTNLVNRRTLFVSGQKLVERAIATQSTISAMMIDIDHFKVINDEYGHDVGDNVIKTIAQLGNETMRSRDILSRLGGEEFAAILPGASIEEARAIAVRLLEKIAQHSFSSLGIERPITVSIGIANLADVCADFDSLLHATDIAMYQGKASGRNQVINFIPSSENSAI